MIDVEKLAREADCAHVNLDGDRSMAIERLSRFAALVLEQAAQNFDSSPNAEMFRQDIAQAIRAMKPEAK